MFLFDHVQDEIVSPHCVAFSLDGSKIYSGFNKMVRVFDTSRPGRQCQKRPTGKHPNLSVNFTSESHVSKQNFNVHNHGIY